MMVLVHPLPLSPSPRFYRVPCPLQFARFLSFFFPLPPLRPCHSVGLPLQQRLITRRPLSGLLRRTPPVDVDQCSLLESSAPYVDSFPTCASGSTWRGCGWGAWETAPPVIDLEFLDASTGVAWRMCFFWLLGFLLVSGFLPSIFNPDGFCQNSWSPCHIFLGACLSLPPPLSPYNRTCPTTLPPNGRVFSWSFHASASRWDRTSCRLPDVSGHRPCPPPPYLFLCPH